MNNGVIDLSLTDLLINYLLVVFVIVISTLNGVDRKKEILISTIRMTVQLFIAGFVLVFIFDTDGFVFPILMFLVMEFFAIYNIISPIKNEISSRFKKVVALSVFTGSTVVLLFFLIVVLKVKPFYNPQYLIPLGGMIIGNSMTAVNLALKTISSNIKDQRDIIEGSLMLGATPRASMDKIIQESFDTAFMPTLNGMKNMGIISLPGMMTGQILSGISPLMAIRYQIAIMVAISASVSICVFLFLNFGYKSFFNEKCQLI
ncbi:MAG: iron export ABC transporter permease subunit FetB [Tissierellia bacterium]|nr:iron export ABC transporter permease subunit FetB [Tissierellia bacterium]